MAKKCYWSYEELQAVPNNEKIKPSGTMGSHYLIVLEKGEKVKVTGVSSSGEEKILLINKNQILGYSAGYIWKFKDRTQDKCPIRRVLAEHKLPQNILLFFEGSIELEREDSYAMEEFRGVCRIETQGRGWDVGRANYTGEAITGIYVRTNADREQVAQLINEKMSGPHMSYCELCCELEEGSPRLYGRALQGDLEAAKEWIKKEVNFRPSNKGPRDIVIQKLNYTRDFNVDSQEGEEALARLLRVHGEDLKKVFIHRFSPVDIHKGKEVEKVRHLGIFEKDPGVVVVKATGFLTPKGVAWLNAERVIPSGVYFGGGDRGVDTFLKDGSLGAQWFYEDVVFPVSPGESKDFVLVVGNFLTTVIPNKVVCGVTVSRSADGTVSFSPYDNGETYSIFDGKAVKTV